MASKELIASVIEAIVKNPPKVTRFKDMETLEHSEAVDYTPTAKAAIATIRAAISEPSLKMQNAGWRTVAVDIRDEIETSDIWCAMLAASPLGEQSNG